MSDEASLREQSTPARVADWIAVAGAAAALLSLALLHVVSPEFDPSWRMISEYATGKFGWLLSFMFAAWGISSLVLLVTRKVAPKAA